MDLKIQRVERSLVKGIVAFMMQGLKDPNSHKKKKKKKKKDPNPKDPKIQITRSKTQLRVSLTPHSGKFDVIL